VAVPVFVSVGDQDICQVALALNLALYICKDSPYLLEYLQLEWGKSEKNPRLGKLRTTRLRNSNMKNTRLLTVSVDVHV